MNCRQSSGTTERILCKFTRKKRKADCSSSQTRKSFYLAQSRWSTFKLAAEPIFFPTKLRLPWRTGWEWPPTPNSVKRPTVLWSQLDTVKRKQTSEWEKKPVVSKMRTLTTTTRSRSITYCGSSRKPHWTLATEFELGRGGGGENGVRPSFSPNPATTSQTHFFACSFQIVFGHFFQTDVHFPSSQGR